MEPAVFPANGSNLGEAKPIIISRVHFAAKRPLDIMLANDASIYTGGRSPLHLL